MQYVTSIKMNLPASAYPLGESICAGIISSTHDGSWAVHSRDTLWRHETSIDQYGPINEHSCMVSKQLRDIGIGISVWSIDHRVKRPQGHRYLYHWCRLTMLYFANELGSQKIWVFLNLAETIARRRDTVRKLSRRAFETLQVNTQ